MYKNLILYYLDYPVSKEKVLVINAKDYLRIKFLGDSQILSGLGIHRNSNQRELRPSCYDDPTQIRDERSS